MGKYLTGAMAGLVLAIALAFAVSLGGWMNVGAVWPDPPPLAWWLHTTYERSVARQASGIGEPVDLDESAGVLAGARAFDDMCSGCHMPPGRSPTVQSQGLNPPPPKLSRLLSRRTSTQAFWVIKNGVRMTGMPAFGLTHPDVHLWQLVAFLKRAQGMDAAAYGEMVAAARAMPASDGHHHRHGGASGEGMPSPGEHHTEADRGNPAKPADQAVPADGHPHATGDHHEH